MTIDDRQLRTHARTLARAYAELEQAKHATGQIRDQRTMRPGGRLGPQTPGHDKPVELCIELETRLYDFVCDAKRYIQPERMLPKSWRPMLDWIIFNAWPLATLDVADELDTELTYQTHRINRLLYPAAPRTDRPEPWQPARQVVTLCAAHGHRVTTAQLRQLAHRGIIDTQPAGNRNLYRPSQVLAHLKGTPNA